MPPTTPPTIAPVELWELFDGSEIEDELLFGGIELVLEIELLELLEEENDDVVWSSAL